MGKEQKLKNINASTKYPSTYTNFKIVLLFSNVDFSGAVLSQYFGKMPLNVYFQVSSMVHTFAAMQKSERNL